jgi:hypothetical protein
MMIDKKTAKFVSVPGQDEILRARIRTNEPNVVLQQWKWMVDEVPRSVHGSVRVSSCGSMQSGTMM